jgi:serine-type D-Ala-D-Ala carboxypeptidase (penicillin-binding protein 5/6)
MPNDPLPLELMLQSSDKLPAAARSRRARLLVVISLVALTGIVAAVIFVRQGHSPGTTPTTAPATTPARTPASTPSQTPIERQAPSRATLAIEPKLVAAGPKPALPWPASGQAEVAIAGLGVMGHAGSGRAVQIASITKVMTAYTVLRDHPLGAGRSGPTLTVTAAEAAAYPQQKADLESLVLVSAGEKLTEREALKGLLIASGDNVAGILARWDAGSVPAFVQRMNRNAQRLGMSSTHYADPSGLSPSSVSTPADLLKLAPVAMAQPTLAELVGTSSAGIPLNPQITNVNTLLGVHQVFGIKSGTTTSAGGCLLFAAHREVNDHVVTIYGAVLGVTGTRSTLHSNARDAGDALVVGAGDSLHPIALVRAGQTVATLIGKDGLPLHLGVAKDLIVTGWSGQTFRFTLPRSLRTGQVPTKLTVHTPTRILTVRLVKQLS